MGKTTCKIMGMDVEQESKCTQTKATKGNETFILKALSVWINKPHVVNRRLCGSTILFAQRVEKAADAQKALETLKSGYADIVKSTKREETKFKDLSKETDNFLILLRELIPKSEYFPNILEVIFYDKQKKSVSFIPLKTDPQGKLPTEELEYTLTIREGDQSEGLDLELTWSPDDETEATKDVGRQVTSRWLRTVLLPKLINWSEVEDITTAITSLQLVEVDRYKDTYVRLKNAYGKDLVKNWTERTDPKKFVYEDVAIAAYLLLIWEEDRKKKNLTEKQSFVDLGCGNGLLVYILTKEGHKGLGIDLRKRKIWDTFGPGIDLKEQAISPSSASLFPEYDWIIGNHSDELTPWIPVIAARSSYKCNFFVLPCCPHDFVGKFSLHNKGKSQYGAYLDYLKEVIVRCGFYPEADTLRIPSTKRACFIGRGRSYSEMNEAKVDEDRQLYIAKRIELVRRNCCNQQKVSRQSSSSSNSENNFSLGRGVSQDSGLGSLGSDSAGSDGPTVPVSDGPSLAHDSDAAMSPFTASNKRKMSTGSTEETEANKMSRLSTEIDQWVAEFKPRVDAGMRNCQAVPNETKKKIVDIVFGKVLNAEGAVEKDIGKGRTWKKGGAVPLESVVSSIGSETLKDLKAECGGLQTLLRNHSHIFQVTKGLIRLRDFTEANPWAGRKPKKNKEKRDRTKTMQCWFFHNHPNGCPRDNEDCTYAHGAGDLKKDVPVTEIIV